MRNSLSPISIGKEKRFKEALNGGSTVPFHDLKSPLVADDKEFKKGWGLGYSQRRVFEIDKDAREEPAPSTYHSSWMSTFNRVKNYSKCTFGEPYDKIRARVEMENKKIHMQV